MAAELTLRALRRRGADPFPVYARTLRAACRSAAPVFGADWYGARYRALASDPRWFAESLLINAAKEGRGSRELWALAGRAHDPGIAEAVRRHALDESGHALMYLAMLDLVFPGAIPPGRRPSFRALSPRYSALDRPPPRRPVRPRALLDALIQMNLGEIRTRINQLLMMPIVAAYCPAGSRGRLARMLRALLRDETRHVRYTAGLIERAVADGERAFVAVTMRRRLALLNRITLSEVGRPERRRSPRGRA
ncbi:MAG TPA: hypothetical protein VFV05_16760 [Methylomirabilota bacterium]|nr:hypothetical protein [Methylomirabilota bacterium]